MFLFRARRVATAWSPVWISLALVAMASPARAIDRFVDDDAPGGNGLNWETAFNDLQDALAVANVGDVIHVAQGTYKPTAGIDRNATFVLPNGVTIRGGFAGVLVGDPDARDTPGQARSGWSG